ncbi:hypothetical protein MRX96_048174 [Rhipicephalus microplus]
MVQDLHSVDLTALQNSGTNLTGFMLLKREVWEQDIGAVREKYTKTGLYPLFLTHRVSWKQIRTDAALTQDALIVLVRAIQSLAKARALEVLPRFSCRKSSAERNLTQSNMLKEAVRKIRFSGLSGPLWLDSSGQRRNVSLYVAKLKRTGLTSVGTWSTSSGLNITQAEKMFEDEILSVLKKKTLRITTILNAPYVMLKKSAHKLEGNDRFEGYCVDLLREISATLGFRYRLKLVRDGAYGTRDSQGRWNGIMRELVEMEADLAIGDLTITSEREESVDFTMPFHDVGSQHTLQGDRPEAFPALLPVSVFGGCVALCRWGVRRRQLQRASSLLLGGSSPSCWFPSYTANLAAFLTKERLHSPIQSAEDLAKQSAVRYGCVRSGSTHALFKEWRHETYEMMWHAMKEDMVSSIAEGLGRVERGGYALLMESTSIEYVVRRRCQLKQIGGSFRLQGLRHRNPAWVSVPNHLVVNVTTAAGARHPAKIQGSLVERHAETLVSFLFCESFIRELTLKGPKIIDYMLKMSTKEMHPPLQKITSATDKEGQPVPRHYFMLELLCAFFSEDNSKVVSFYPSRYFGQINPPKRPGKGPNCGIAPRLLSLIKAL